MTFACWECAAALEKKPGPGRNPRFCGERCRYRYHNQPGPGRGSQTTPETARAAARARWDSAGAEERTAAASSAARARWAGHLPAPPRPTKTPRACRFCGEVVPMTRVQQSCGAPECRLARNAERMREGGWPKARRAQRVSTEVEQFSPLDIFERDSWTCGICHGPVDPALRWPDVGSASLDHVIPLSKGGSHTPGNTRCTHLTCNVARGNRADI